MEIVKQRPVKRRKPVVCLEVAIAENFGEARLEISASIPGREALIIRDWPMRNGYLEYGIAEDCHAWVSSMINAGVWSFAGFQEVLPLEVS